METTVQEQAIRQAESMRIFAGDSPTFKFGEYKAWAWACYVEGRTIPPDEFRAWPDEKRHPSFVAD